MARFRSSATPCLALIAALMLGTLAGPALADDSEASSSDPCGAASSQCIRGTDSFAPIMPPQSTDFGVFITQVGETNRAEVRQAAGNSYARVTQDGAENSTVINQGARGRHYAQVAQDGESNRVDSGQDGIGQTVLLLAQQGDRNRAIIRQNDNGSAYSAAAVRQSGNGNELLLVQDGSDNQARLTQDGNDNAMTATQLSSGNRLDWSQIGDGLANLQIVQTGNGALQITQSNSGAQFAPAPGSGS